MRFLWLIFTLIPAPFLFHFYEYGQHVRQVEASFLFLGALLHVVITGVLAGHIKYRYIILINIITGILSLFLAIYLIPDDGDWFKPLGRDLTIIFTAIVFLIGQLLVSFVSKAFFARKGD
ncbi:hypothetical protein HXA31_02330 [Salipaludibacillus agaradhaerens]|uniref:Uncharacterized protein n=1 Tax=Salipaludibacillus agaradhaerens TaxID=76935 RepID=A0A9Q4B2P9_SALAG|nr:hypothetical protein [Salipaludibacillus agaradhaerens]MCR6097313.1 hypothetical protein [Salipaludibacillus agaradhaerens]MCR6113202.1 hypothetical protein [Salipaludibacillus agaradhaerens]